MRSNLLRCFVVLITLAPGYAAAEKLRVGIWVDGERADQLHGALYAGVVNAVEMVPSEDVQAALAGARAVPAEGKPLDELTWEKEALEPARKVAESLGLDLLVIARSVRRSDKHLAVTAIAVSPSGEKPIAFNQTWTLKGSGSGVEQTFNFKGVAQALSQFFTRKRAAEGS